MTRPLQMRAAGVVAAALLAAVLLLSGCGGARTAPHPPAADRIYAQSSRAARAAFDGGDYRTARDLYRRALARAYAGNDAAAIADTRYNLAVCLLKLAAYEEGLALVNLAAAELSRTGRGISPEFTLLEAALVYRTGQLDAAWALTDTLLKRPGGLPPAVQGRAYYLRGRMAHERGDFDGLRAAAGAMGAPEGVALLADRAELHGRLALCEGRWSAAVSQFGETVGLRRELGAYGAMCEALELSARALEAAGEPGEAAIRYLEAGRSAASRGDGQQARHWLETAAALAEKAGEGGLAAEARALSRESGIE